MAASTWRLGTNSASSRLKFGFRIEDPFGLFDEDGKDTPPATVRPPSPEEEYPVGMRSGATLAQSSLRVPVIRGGRRRYHPDANGGAKEAEERFKQISEAYTLLMSSLGAWSHAHSALFVCEKTAKGLFIFIESCHRLAYGPNCWNSIIT